MEDLRELHKLKFGKYPSSQMKEETLIAKLKENIPVLVKDEPKKEIHAEVISDIHFINKKEPAMTTIENMVTKVIVPIEDKTVVRMTTRRRNWLKRQEALNK